jgi:hypothetical protein
MLLRDPTRTKNTTLNHTLARAQRMYRHWQEHGYLPPPNREHYVYSEVARRFIERAGVERWHEILADFERHYSDTTRRVIIADPGPLPGLDVDPTIYDRV